MNSTFSESVRRSMVNLLVATVLVAGGCGGPTANHLGGIYNEAAARHEIGQNPVIVIPGILGSRLVDDATGQVVWGAFGGGSANPEQPKGARLVSVPMREGAPLAALTDDVRTDGALDRITVNLIGLPVELQAYGHILGTLGVGGYRDELLGEAGAIDYGDDHYTCFQFDYDWRLDNVANAARLDAFIREKRAYVLAEQEMRHGRSDPDLKFDIVAHSMGGLVTRWYLRYGAAEPNEDGTPPPLTWAGAESVEHAVLVGTPNAGSVEGLHQLVDGIQFVFFLPRYDAAVLGTMPSIYQLLPRDRHRAVLDAAGEPVPLLDRATWEENEWGLADPAQDRVLARLLPDVPTAEARRRIALDHLDKCLRRADAFFAGLDVAASPPTGLEISIVAGDAVETAAVSHVQTDGRPKVVERGPGDGTVLRTSAILDERVGAEWRRGVDTPITWHHTLFLFSDHLGLTKDPVFTDNVLYWLLEE